ncbi:hypothetical protein L9F63_009976, partial [Diploptera punctata]
KRREILIYIKATSPILEKFKVSYLLIYPRTSLTTEREMIITTNTYATAVVNIFKLMNNNAGSFHQRPCHVENTSSLPIASVNKHRARMAFFLTLEGFVATVWGGVWGRWFRTFIRLLTCIEINDWESGPKTSLTTEREMTITINTYATAVVNIFIHKEKNAGSLRQRPYHVENTSSRPIAE